MRKVISFLTLFFTVNTAIGQKKNPIEMAKEITASASTDSLKVRAIYEWIALNISYDVEYLEEMKNNDPKFQKKQSPETVLKKKKGVCYGYANLFNEMCKAVNIESQLILGNSKDIDELGGKPVFSQMGHAWNAVYVNKQWYLLDPTWSSGHLNAKGKFKQQLNEDYYLSNGKTFIKDHMPFDPLWQMLEKPVAFETFRLNREEQVGATPTYFNFQDSLKNFRLQDEPTRHQKFMDRALKFNPTNDYIRIMSANDFSQKGFDFIDFQNANKGLYQSIKNAEEAQKALNTKTEYFEKLREGEAGMVKARYYYNSVARSSVYYEVAQINVKNMENNLKSFRDVRTQMSKFFTDIERIYLKKGR